MFHHTYRRYNFHCRFIYGNCAGKKIAANNINKSKYEILLAGQVDLFRLKVFFKIDIPPCVKPIKDEGRTAVFKDPIYTAQ